MQFFKKGCVRKCFISLYFRLLPLKLSRISYSISFPAPINFVFFEYFFYASVVNVLKFTFFAICLDFSTLPMYCISNNVLSFKVLMLFWFFYIYQVEKENMSVYSFLMSCNTFYCFINSIRFLLLISHDLQFYSIISF